MTAATDQAVEAEDPRADLRWGTIPALVAEAAARLGDAEAVVDGQRRLTYAQLGQEVSTFTRALMAAGVATGDRVAIWAPNCAEWVIGALGALGAGAVLVPLNTRFKGGEAAYILRASGATVLLTVQGFLGLDYPAMLADQDTGQLRLVVVLRGGGAPGGSATATTAGGAAGAAAGSGPATLSLAQLTAGAAAVSPGEAARRSAAISPDDVSDLIFTSGTTGQPKGAMATHGQSLRTFGTWSSVVGLTEGDRYLVVNPFFHTFGYKAGLLACLMAGATVLPEPVFAVDAVLARIAAERVSVLPGPPTLYQSLLAHPDRATHDLSSLRLGVTGAAVVPVELVVAMGAELGFSVVLTAYGLTESCGTVTMCRRGDPPEIVATTAGRAIPGLEVAVVGPAHDELPRGQTGEIVVHGYTVMAGYWDDPERTAETIDADGWLHTGDLGVMDGAGNLTVTDRLKDMYVVGGFNAYPAEIEAILRGCPDIAQVAVTGVPDQRLGEVGCAWVVPAGAGPDDAQALGRRILAWARPAMANYKVPRFVAVVGELPLNASGKVVKRQLRERFAPGGGDGFVVVSSERGLSMRGIVYTGDGVEVTDELEVGEPGPTEVKVRIAAAGVCHSDLSVIDGTIPWKPPAVLGHEGAGVVEAVGSAVRSLKPGNHVVIATLASCGTCRACSTGHPTWCRRTLGNISTPFTYRGQPASNFAAASVFAESTIVAEVQAVRIPEDVPLTSACLIGCGVLTGVGSVLNRARVRPGETAAVFGVGGVGLNVIQGLRIAGATRIVAVDTVAGKEALGRQFGATHFVDASAGDAAAAVRALVGPNRESAAGSMNPLGGVTWAFDCVGHPAVLRSALDCLDWGGTAVAIGIPARGTEVAVDVNALAYVDRGLLGCRYGAARPHHDIPLMIDLYRSGQLLLDELVSLTRPLEAFREVVDEMHAGRVARGVLTF